MFPQADHPQPVSPAARRPWRPTGRGRRGLTLAVVFAAVALLAAVTPRPATGTAGAAPSGAPHAEAPPHPDLPLLMYDVRGALEQMARRA